MKELELPDKTGEWWRRSPHGDERVIVRASPRCDHLFFSALSEIEDGGACSLRLCKPQLDVLWLPVVVQPPPPRQIAATPGTVVEFLVNGALRTGVVMTAGLYPPNVAVQTVRGVVVPVSPSSMKILDDPAEWPDWIRSLKAEWGHTK